MTKYFGGKVETYDKYQKEHPDGIGEMLRDKMMHKGLLPFGEGIKTRAELLAPRSYSFHKMKRLAGRKHYADSFGVEAHTGPVPGSESNEIRAYVEVYNDAANALYIEWGNANIRKHATLRRAMGQEDFSGDSGSPRTGGRQYAGYY